MHIKIYVVTHKINSFYQDAIREYAKRLTRYCKIQLIHCKSDKVLQNKMNDKDYIIHISSHSPIISSVELSEKFNYYMVSSYSNITFVIGSSCITPSETLSISHMDMSSDLLTTILYEQIYRAYRIMNNHPYHK
jgi:23S rRNA (pseudouridine1915-N3)-methyltransferase